jgi:hypothetical protein
LGVCVRAVGGRVVAVVVGGRVLVDAALVLAEAALVDVVAWETRVETVASGAATVVDTVAASIPGPQTVKAASPARAPPINTTRNMRERDTPGSG